MRYTEKEYKFEITTPLDFIQDVVVGIFVAPFRLCNEISQKIIYMKRDMIENILLYSFVIGASYTFIYSVYRVWSGTFNLWLGEFPLIMRLICVLLLGGLYLWFYTFDFIIYKQLASVLPLSVKEQSLEEEIVEENSTNTYDITKPDENYESAEDTLDTLYKNTDDANEDTKEVEINNGLDLDLESIDLDFDNLDFNNVNEIKNPLLDEIESGENHYVKRASEHTDFINPSVFTCEEVIAYQKDVENNVNKGNITKFSNLHKVSAQKLKEIKHNIDTCTDPSKYLTEDLLQIMRSNEKIDNFGTIECLDISYIPDSYKLVTWK